MYQPCTSTAVNHGEQRGLAADLQSALTRQNTRLPGRSETTTISLITRRSQVQILPPPLRKALVDRKIRQGFRRFSGPCRARCQRFVNTGETQLSKFAPVTSVFG